ncbi:tape measure protein, partial [Streptomyces sp. P17]|uniref:tape measure protein n=1 Tax=Streptomyces sp. P17 TaxID=3074716 RepID=UPI0028F3F447
EYAFGGMQGASEQMDWVRGVAQELGLELKCAANGYAHLASATKNIGMSTEHTQQVFKGVAAAAAKMNLTTDETNGVLLALSQIAGKGIF